MNRIIEVSTELVEAARREWGAVQAAHPRWYDFSERLSLENGFILHSEAGRWRGSVTLFPDGKYCGMWSRFKTERLAGRLLPPDRIFSFDTTDNLKDMLTTLDTWLNAWRAPSTWREEVTEQNREILAMCRNLEGWELAGKQTANP